MRAPEMQLRLKNGTVCALRSPDAGDAVRRIAFQRQVNGQTNFLARGTKDSPGDADLIAEMLEDQLEDDAATEIAAFCGDEMVGSAVIGPAARGYPRRRHRARLGVCVRKEFWGMGLGSALVRSLIGCAPEMGFEQIELSVVADNRRAIALYERLGFTEVGRVPDALKYEDGTYAEEIWMVLKLKDA